MVNNLTDVQKEHVKEVFILWKSNKQQVKEFNEINRDAVKALGQVLDCKSKVIVSTFRFMQTQEEKGEDELEDISTLFTVMDNE
jgi:hypothetical protein